MSDLSYADRAVTHRIHNNGTSLYRAIGVINETAGGDETITEEAAGFSGKAEMSNRWFRVHRVTLAPGEKAPAHQHKAPVVVLQDSTGKGIASGPMTFEFNEPGQWGFFDAGARHEMTNTGTERLELLEVEVRRR
jgi:mannose-6-phosphate isomerase-like protein (cupin superfamily)